MAESWTLHFDGACDVNPGGIAAYGFVIKKAGVKVKSGKGLAVEPGSQDATNNVAEYTGLLKGLEEVAVLLSEGDSLEVIGDSELTIRQLKGEYQVKAATLMPLYAKAAPLAHTLTAQGKKVTFKWIPRHMNGEADKLSKDAVQEAVVADPGLPGKAKARHEKLLLEKSREQPPESGQGLLF
jgi:ribonuclease HI